MGNCLSSAILLRGIDLSFCCCTGRVMSVSRPMSLIKPCFFVWLGAVSSSRPEPCHAGAAARGGTLEQAGLIWPCPSDAASNVPPCVAADNLTHGKSSISHAEPTSRSPSWAVPFWLRPVGQQARIRWNLPAPYHDAPCAGPLGTWGAGPILTAAIAAIAGHGKPAHPGGFRRQSSPSQRGARLANPGKAVLLVPVLSCVASTAPRQAEAKRVPDGISPVST
jgi:hypothetical protein